MRLKSLLFSIVILSGMTINAQVSENLFVKPTSSHRATSAAGGHISRSEQIKHSAHITRNVPHSFRGPTAYASVTNVISEEVTYAHYDIQSPDNLTVINNEELYGGVYLDGYLYAYDIYEGFQWFNKIDPFTGEILWYDGSTYYQKEMTYDYTTATAYGTYNNEFFTVNLATGDVTKIGDFPTEDPIYVLACALDGTLYAISGGRSSALYIVDKQTAALSMVGYTGIDEDYEVLYLQSGGFDYNTGILYWCEYETDTWMYVYDYSCIRTVDLETGHSTEIASTENLSQLCFFIPYDDPNPKENAFNLDGEYVFDYLTGKLSASLSWETVTTNTIQGFNIYRGTNLEEMELLNSLPKNVTSYTDGDMEAGTYYYQLKAVYNNGLESVPAKTVDDADFLVVEITDISENQNVTTRIYPNPATDFINIEGINAGTIQVFNSLGQLVRSLENTRIVDVRNYPSGIYMMVINNERKVRFVKE